MARSLLSLALVGLSALSLAAGQSISFSTVVATASAPFPPREYAACTQTAATTTNTPTLYFYGGFSVTLNASASTTSNSYYDSYLNDAWSSTNFGQTWTQLTGAAAFPAQAWNSAVVTNSGKIVYIGQRRESKQQLAPLLLLPPSFHSSHSALCPICTLHSIRCWR